MPTLTPGIMQAWRGALARRRCRQLRAAYAIMAFYKRQKVRAYLRELLRRFQAVRTLPDFGKSVEWPEPPAVLARFQEASQRLFRRYRPVPRWPGDGGQGHGTGMGAREHGKGTWFGNVRRRCGMGTWAGDRDMGQGHKKGTWDVDVEWGCRMELQTGTGTWDKDTRWGCGHGMGMQDGDMGMQDGIANRDRDMGQGHKMGM